MVKQDLDLKGTEVWAVVPINLEYNDETYDPQGYEQPEAIFTIKEMAEEYASELTLKKIKSESKWIYNSEFLGGFIYYEDPPELKQEDREFLDRIEFNYDDDAWCFKDEDVNLTDDDWFKLLKIINLNFYEVAAVPVIC